MAKGLRGSYKKKRDGVEGGVKVEDVKSVEDFEEGNEVDDSDDFEYDQDQESEVEVNDTGAPIKPLPPLTKVVEAAVVTENIKLEEIDSPDKHNPIKPNAPLDEPPWKFTFNKSQAGQSVIVVTVRNDGKQTQMTFPNDMRADEFIRNKKEEIAKAEERRLENLYKTGLPLSRLTKKYGKGVEISEGEMILTSLKGDKVVVVPELKEAVEKWIKSRGVSSFRVDDNGLTIVTYPDYQKNTFNIIEGSRVHQSNPMIGEKG